MAAPPTVPDEPGAAVSAPPWNGPVSGVVSFWRLHPGAWSMTRREFPIGIQSFRNIPEQDCYYEDKPPLSGG